MNRLACALSTLSFFALTIGGAASAQTVLLPPGPLTHSTTPAVAVSDVDTTQTVQFTVTFTGLPAGLSISNQSYLGWCPDFWGDFNQNNATTPYTPYSTDDVAHLPANAQNVNWPAVNWVLNHKPTGAQSTWIVQQTIWRLLANQYAPANQGFPLPQPATDNLYNQAVAQGSFVPTAGQTIGVLLYIDGIDPFPAQNGLPSNGKANNFQEILVEVPVGPGAIGDFVWQDTNQNGIQDAGEPGINGVNVKLCADSNCATVIATTTTATFRGVDGYYQFSGMPLGTYWVSIDGSQPALSGLVPTITGAGTPATDSNVNPSVTTLTVSQPQDETIDFGFTSPGTSAIGDFVWQDNNANGLQDSGEPGLSGLTVNLCADQNCNTILKTTTTDQNGFYHFTGLFAGTYFVQVVPGQNFVATTPQVGFPDNASIDSGGPVQGVPSQVNLPVNTIDNTLDFGFVPPANGAIGDFVWHDVSRNGIQDAGEPGINNVTVRLLDSSNALLATTTTVTNGGQDGYYQFTGLGAGTYSVIVDGSTLPPNFTPTTSSAPGSTTANDSNGSPASVTLATNISVDQTIDFGYVSPCAGVIGDFVWIDANGNGIQDAGELGLANVMVSLYGSNHVLLLSTNTDSLGHYQFTGLCPATYTVQVTPPAGFQTTPTNAPGSTPDNDSNPSPATVTLANDATDNSIDFGFYPSLTGHTQCSSNTSGEVGIAYNVSPPSFAGGVAPFTYSVASGSLPAGLSLDPATGIVSGTPSEPGSFTLQVTDAFQNVVVFACPYTIVGAPSLACSSVTGGEVGIPFNSPAMSVTGGTGPFTFTVATGALPAGLTLDASSGAITGTPQSPGTFTIQVTDANGVVATGNCPFTILAAPSLACSAVTGGEVGVAFSSPAMTVSGGTAPFKFSVATGTLPAGLTLDATTGAITGTPQSAGTFTIQVTDANNVVATGSCPFTIVAAPSLACSAVTGGEVGIAFSSPAMTVTGGTGPFKFAVATGTLPTGLTLNATTGAITGTPQSSGTFTIQVTDANNVVATGSCPFTIVAAPSLACSAVTGGEVGIAFSSPAMTVSGGTAPFKFSVATGTLPTGLTLDATTGAITGTPQSAGTFTIQVTDANNVVATGSCPFTIVAAPSLACSSSSTGEVGAPFTGTSPTVSGGTGPFTFAVASGTLPAGLSLNASTGAITGTPMAAGTFTLKVTDSLGATATGTCPYTIAAGPSLACSSSSTGEVGAPFNGAAPTVSGGTGPFTFAVASGTLPAGLSLNASTGAITGTPTAAGTFTLKVTDSLGATATGTCPYTIAAGPSLACSSSSTGEVGAPFTGAAPTVSGGTGPYTFAVATGALPAGLSLNASTGAITGTPTAAGTFTLKVTDSLGSTATGTCPYTIAAGPSLACSSSSTGEVGAPFTGAAPTVNGGKGPYTFAVASGTLPAGLTLNASTGVITGTPTAAGSFTLKVTDSLGSTATGTCPYTIAAAPSLACSSSSTGEVGAPFTGAGPTVSGGTGPYIFAVASGSLPAGLTLNASTGAITGTPSAAGTFTLKVTDSLGSTATGTCPYTIAAGPSLACSASSTGEVGAPFTGAAPTVSGGTGPYTFAVATGALPAGLSLNASTGAITGTPTATGSFTLKVTDGKGATATGTCPYTISSGPSLTCSASSTGEVGAPFTGAAPTVSGGTGPYTFAVASGTLPAGLTLNTSTGAITGTATAAGTFTLKVTDSKNATATGTCPYTIAAGPSLACSSTSSGVIGKAFSSPALTVTGGTAPFKFAVASGALPTGLTLNTSTGAITGTPTAAGSFTLKVTDSKGSTATGTCPYTIATAPTTDCQSATVYKGVAITPITLTGSGGAGGPYTFTATGLPPGLTISSSGKITGTPTSTGTYTYVLTIKDVNGNVGTVSCCSITVNTPTAPVCKVYDNGNPPYMTYQDTGSGLVKLTVTTNSNFNVGLSPVPSGTTYSPAVSSLPYPMPTGEVITFPATNALLTVSALRINTSKSAQLTVMATNAAGLTTTCDPITTVVTSMNWQSGLNGLQTFTNIPQAADLIEITNGNPGLSDLVILVNYVPFIEYKMTNGQSMVVNVGKAMQPGNNNTIMLVGIGIQKNSSAQVNISQ